MVEIKKSVRLNILEPTNVKRREIDMLIGSYRQALHFVVSKGNSNKTRFSLQKMFYNEVKTGFMLHSQVANDLFKDAAPILNNGGNVGRVTVPFNIPRSGKFATTKNGNPVVSIAGLNGRRIVIPIARDGAYERFRQLERDGYSTTFFRFDGEHIFVTLKKEFDIPEEYDAIVGVDIGVDNLATVSVIDRKGKLVRQLYLGQDVGHKVRDIGIRRSKLQAYADKGSRYARQALRRLKRYETDYTRTRCYQVAHEIVEVAVRYNAFIAIEDLKHLNRARGNRKSNRKTKRMPYARLRLAIESVAGQNNVMVRAVNPKYTSQICSRCGMKGNRKGPYFVCPNCGYEANSDRNASVNIAIRAGLIYHTTTRFFRAQIPDRNLAVNPGDFVHDGIGTYCLQHYVSSPRQAPSFKAG